MDVYFKIIIYRFPDILISHFGVNGEHACTRPHLASIIISKIKVIIYLSLMIIIRSIKYA